MQWILGDSSKTIDIDSRMPIVTMILLSVIGVCVFILQPGYVQGLVEYLGFSDEQAGYIASAEMFGVAASTIILIFISSRFNWRALVTVYLGICTLGNLSSISVTDFDTLTIIRFITGLGSGGVISLGFTMMGLTQKSDRNFGYIITWVLIYGAFGLLLMPSAFHLIGMNGILLFFALFCSSGFFFVKYLPIAGEHHVDERTLNSVAYSWQLKGISLLAILVYNIAIGITWAYLFLLGIEANITEQAVANVLTISQFLGIAGAFLAVLLQLRIGRTIPLMIGVLGGALGVYCLVGNINYLFYSLGIYLFNLLWNLSMPYLLATMADFDPTGKMVVYGVSMQTTGTAMGPGIAALILGYSDYDTVYIVATVLFIASALLLLPGLRAQRAQIEKTF